MDWRVPVPAPERLEVVGEADLSAAVHLGRLAVELGQRDLGRRHGERHRDVELHVELVLEELVDVPALAEPPRTLLVRLKPEASICTVILNKSPKLLKNTVSLMVGDGTG